ncbi:hypothetical protein ACFU9B_23255 [Streptomyces sp. NPDC057592]|uniref:hypothetical protein n=1 Tax=unclassified Streptomyces TaxID=2593676 RepID=UPI0036D1BBD7
MQLPALRAEKDVAVATDTREALQMLADVGQGLVRESDGANVGRQLRSLVEEPAVLHLGLGSQHQDHATRGVDVAVA